VTWRDKVLEDKKISQHHFVHHKSYTDWPGIEVGPPRKTAVYLPLLLHRTVQIVTIVLPVAARLLRSWVRIPPAEWIFVCCECRVLSGRGLCDELITRPEESPTVLRRCV
jgi:hypothetical protein